MQLLDLYKRLREIKDFATGTAPDAIDVFAGALRKTADAADDISKYLRSLAGTPVFSTADAEARSQLEGLLAECEGPAAQEATAQGPVLNAIIRAAIAELIRRLLAGNAPAA